MCCHLALVRGIDNDDHSNPHIECPVHLAIGHAADSLEQLENRQHRPGLAIELGSGAGRQDSWNVLEQAAAGDVGEALDDALAEQAIKRAKVAPMRLEQLAGDRGSEVIEPGIDAISRNVEQELSREAVAVCVKPN